MPKENAVEEVVEDLMTDPDADAERAPAPRPPQTTDAEPSGDTPAR